MELYEYAGAIELSRRRKRSTTVPALHPERKGQLNRSPLKNWIEKNGGLPTYINSIATALLRENPGWSISRVVATAVNAVKKMCSTGKAFGGKGTVSTAVKAAACRAVAQWEKKKAAASNDFVDDKLISLSEEGSWEYVYSTMRKKYREEGLNIPDLIHMSDEAYFKHVLNEPYEVEDLFEEEEV